MTFPKFNSSEDQDIQLPTISLHGTGLKSQGKKKIIKKCLPIKDSNTLIFWWICLSESAVPMSMLSLMHTKSSFIFVSKFNIFWISFLVITMTSGTEESGMKVCKKIHHLNHKHNTFTFYLESQQWHESIFSKINNVRTEGLQRHDWENKRAWNLLPRPQDLEGKAGVKPWN